MLSSTDYVNDSKIGNKFPLNQTLRLVEEKLTSLLQSCSFPHHLHQIQAQSIIHGLHHHPFLAPKIAAAAFRLGSPIIARHLFDQIPQPNAVLGNVVIKGHHEVGDHREALELFRLMIRRNVRPSHYTFPFVIKSCARMNRVGEIDGEEVHCVVIKTGFEGDAFVVPALIEMYAKMGRIGRARKAFEQMCEKNAVAVTAMIAAYLTVGDVGCAREIFDRTAERDIIMWNTMISWYSARGDIGTAQELFDQMTCQDVMSWNTLLLGYAECGDVEACERLFNEMPEKNVFSWNGLIGAYVRSNMNSEALNTFNRLLSSPDVEPNDATIVAVLSACSKLGFLNWGRWLHVYAQNNDFESSVHVGNGLIDMYAKCGCIEDAMTVFESMKVKDLITYNSILLGLATHGRGADALNLFDEVTSMGEKPDGITFLGVLSACVHMGLVEGGFRYFRLMTKKYLIEPSIEHYGCLIDLLGRAGLLNEAVEFMKKMSIKPDCVIWSALLGACQVHREIGLAEIVMSQLIKVGPEEVPNSVVLSNLYGGNKRWVEAARMKKMARESSLGRLPGCSLVEVNCEGLFPEL
ncbi:Pentatricopeptide repeat-containing protein, chloroplastic [Ananas comosus]|uniref:Pentatricopeptide repeat-containing protein, chloroplastic n=1 Tax=Ananas comosus TaxID=4615 RepID=A0A199VE03_ANACO|nr:Pentatricopeptide repeat-containing protein, chloroplastic [Ananas comosus]